MHAFTRRNPRLHAALAEHQAVADRQAARWIEGELFREFISWAWTIEDGTRNTEGHLAVCPIYAGPAVRRPCTCKARPAP